MRSEDLESVRSKGRVYLDDLGTDREYQFLNHMRTLRLDAEKLGENPGRIHLVFKQGQEYEELNDYLNRNVPAITEEDDYNTIRFLGYPTIRQHIQIEFEDRDPSHVFEYYLVGKFFCDHRFASGVIKLEAIDDSSDTIEIRWKEKSNHEIVYVSGSKEYFIEFPKYSSSSQKSMFMFSRMNTKMGNEDIPPLFREVIPKFFTKRLIYDEEISHFLEESCCTIRLIRQNQVAIPVSGKYVERIYGNHIIYRGKTITPVISDDRKLLRTRFGYVIKHNKESTVVVSLELFDDCDYLLDFQPTEDNPLPTFTKTNRGISFWYDCVESAFQMKNENMIEALRKSLGISDINEYTDSTDDISIFHFVLDTIDV